MLAAVEIPIWVARVLKPIFDLAGSRGADLNLSLRDDRILVGEGADNNGETEKRRHPEDHDSDQTFTP